MKYEELIAMNRAAYEQRKKKELQTRLVKCVVYAVSFAVCGTVAIFVWNKYEAHKKQAALLAAEEARRIEEAAYRKAEEQRLSAAEEVRKRAEERLAQERKREEERLAREKQREEERLAWERTREEERLAREKARKEKEEKMAEDRRRREEECKASEERRLAAERKRQEEKRVKDEEARLLREGEESLARVAERRKTPIGKTLQTPDKKNSVDLQLEFLAAKRDMGGSVLEALVRKLNNNIEDEDMAHTSSRNARAVAMSKIRGIIGPVDYSRQIKTKKITSMQAIGEFDGYGNGGVVSGTIYAPVTSIKEKVGGFVANVPAGFKKGFEKLMTVARRGHSRANAEAGACIFVDATKGQIGMNERRALTLFSKAADLGDADGMFMEAFCLFYGIGRMSTSKKDIYEAYRILSSWQSQPGAQSLRGSGWVRRRLKEASQLGY